MEIDIEMTAKGTAFLFRKYMPKMGISTKRCKKLTIF